MRILITGAAGNLGSYLARSLLDSPHKLRLLIHRQPLRPDLAACPNVSVFRADLREPITLGGLCEGVDCIVHFAGLLFAPRPEKFLPLTNLGYVQNLVTAALPAGVRKFILISFPHVEGESSPEKPASGRFEGNPISVHAQTRLAAEKHFFAACAERDMVAVSLRAGLVYARGVKMIDAAHSLLERRLLGVWKRPTWYHLISLPDFLCCVRSAIEQPHVSGIYNIGDDRPLTLQEFLDTVAAHWGLRKPWRAPEWSFYAAAWCCEAFATVFGTAAPLTRDFIRIGMVSHAMDTSLMKKALLPQLAYPTLRDGLRLL